MRELQTFNILDVPDNVVSKMASTVVAVEMMGIQVGEISARRDHLELVQEARRLITQFEKLQEQLEKVCRRLAELST